VCCCCSSWCCLATQTKQSDRAVCVLAPPNWTSCSSVSMQTTQPFWDMNGLQTRTEEHVNQSVWMTSAIVSKLSQGTACTTAELQ
jgi:hypothetical protein